MKRYLRLAVSIIGLIGIVFGSVVASRSTYFSIRSIEVVVDSTEPELARLYFDEDEIAQLSGIELGADNLFWLELSQVQARIRSHPWVADVLIEKRLPNGIRFRLKSRRALAYIQDHEGLLAYVDENGQSYRPKSIVAGRSLPLLGPEFGEATKMGLAVSFIKKWNEEENRSFRLEGIKWDQKRGFRIAIKPLAHPELDLPHLMVYLGQEFDDSAWFALPQIHSAIEFLRHQKRNAHQVVVASRKKIVVKTTPSS